MSKQELWKACQTSEWKCPLCKPCWRYTIAQLIQEYWYNRTKYCITLSETHFMLLFHMRFIDVVSFAFLGGVQSSHGHVLLNMHYNTTLIAIIGWAKTCLTGIECWIGYQLKGKTFIACAASHFERSLQPKISHVQRSIANLWKSEGKF